MGMRGYSYIDDLIRDEGVRLDPYIDPDGNLTGGIGHLMTEQDKKEFNPDWDQAKKLAFWVEKFLEDLDNSIRDVNQIIIQKLLPLNKEQIEVLVNMRFNLGREGLLGFKKMFLALKQKNVKWAADEMIDSKWHRDLVKWSERGDIPSLRSRRLERKMRNSLDMEIETNV